MKLTDLQVRSAKPTDKKYKLADGGGLYLLVSPNGSKLWHWKYRVEGKEKLMAFGPYPEVTIAKARDLHTRARKALDAGTDPMRERKNEKIAAVIAANTAKDNSFESVARAWHTHWSKGKDAANVGRCLRAMETNLFPTLGSLPVTEIKTSLFVVALKQIENRGAPEVARRTLGTINKIYRYASAHDLAERNPVADLKPGTILVGAPVEHFARVDVDELPGLLRKIEVYRGASLTRLAIKLMALTFVRTQELIKARWSEFDFQKNLWTIPAHRMKQVKNVTPHIVPLSKQALDVLAQLREAADNADLLFPCERGGTKTMSNNTILYALERMGYKGEMTGHGFRGLASTILNESRDPRFDPKHIEVQLAHVERNKVTAAYNAAVYLEDRTEMMQWWADYLDGARQKRRLGGLFAAAG
ncbi:integrase arm-type DNA-binding domain-containing protein [Granulicella sp. L60]|uniref:tyrosine-type recombinase/integrase n=1 Tax=Granulicella sp. L60 TaxID=1641866 RepID=UPI00131E9C8B|nr:integrase arm-type DNA-binding domain-containing protein [Granulicella sp. L60]